MRLTLSQLPVGQPARLHAVGGQGSYRRRLMELGFVPGTVIRLIRRVDIGDVLEVEVRSSRMSLRITEARCLEVEPLDTKGDLP